MNRALYIDELVKRIASNIENGSKGSASLLALACCCKALEGPVMDLLWQRQKFLHIILQTLPADCWTITDGEYRFSRHPEEGELNRFRRYTERVVELWSGIFPDGRVSFMTIAFLGMESKRNPLWPRLVSLRLSTAYTGAFMASVPTFLSSKVKSLALFLPQAVDTRVFIRSLIPMVSDRCQGVEDLSLHIAVGDSNSANGVAELISTCRDTLRTLYISPPFKMEYLPTIASLPQLRGLTLDKAYLPPTLPPGAFPTLEEFTFPSFQGPHPQHFLNHLRTTNLKVVKIHCANSIDIKGLIAMLSRFSTSLRVLEITPAMVLSSFDLTPLPPFTTLKEVHLCCLPRGEFFHTPCTLRLSDQDVGFLGTAMPNLVHLTLGSQTCSSLRRVTFQSLINLSRTCQHLETLKIQVDFQAMVDSSVNETINLGTDETPDETEGVVCNLRALSLGASPFPSRSNARRIVAIGLKKIFPSLSDVTVTGHGSKRSKWEDVRRDIRMLQRC